MLTWVTQVEFSFRWTVRMRTRARAFSFTKHTVGEAGF